MRNVRPIHRRKRNLYERHSRRITSPSTHEDNTIRRRSHPRPTACNSLARPASSKRIGQYVRNWWRWVRAGVEISVMNAVPVAESSGTSFCSPSYCVLRPSKDAFVLAYILHSAHTSVMLYYSPSTRIVLIAWRDDTCAFQNHAL